MEAERLRREQGEASYHYLECLHRIEARPSIYKGHTFREFLKETKHGPWERYQRFVETVEAAEEYEERHPSLAKKLRKSLVETMGFEATSQVLNKTDEGKRRDKAFAVLIDEAVSTGRPLTYQSATNILYDKLKIPKEPTKSVRGGKLDSLRKQLLRLREEVATKIKVILTLQKRLRDAGLDATLPKTAP
jgi:hypothetical protein